MSVSVAKFCELSGHTSARSCVQLVLLRIRVNVQRPRYRDQRDNRGDQPNWPPIRLHVECSPSSQQRRFHTMPRSKKGVGEPARSKEVAKRRSEAIRTVGPTLSKGSVNRRGFLKG